MRIVRDQQLTGITTRLVCTKQELATFTRAQVIVDSARHLLRATIGEEAAEESNIDTTLAMISISVDEIIEGLEIDWARGFIGFA